MTITAARPRPAVRKKPLQLSPPWRKVTVLLHVISSMTWLGLTLANLTLAVIGITTTDPRTQHTVYLAVDMVGGVLLIPVALGAFGTGVVLSLTTPWGLFRYRWVAVKFWLTLFAAVMTLFSLLPEVRAMAETVAATPPDQLARLGDGPRSLFAAACVSGTIYLTATALSVFKPWGRSKGKLARVVG